MQKKEKDERVVSIDNVAKVFYCGVVPWGGAGAAAGAFALFPPPVILLVIFSDVSAILAET